MNEVNTTPEVLPGAPQLSASADGGAVDGGANQEFTLKASDLKAALGKDFKDPTSALKSIKDTFSYVGKVGQLEAELNTLKSRPGSVATDQNISEVKNELKGIREDLWYEKNPQYKDYRTVISKLGDAPDAVVGDDKFKGLFDKVRGFDDTQKLKTVLESNPRLASSQDKFTKAREVANRRGRQGEASELVTQGVMEAYGMTE